MSDSDTDADWESWAKDNPYWAVLTKDRFRNRNLDAGARADFFSSGEDYIAWVYETICSKLSRDFAPADSLDFGCGVGRLVLPLAARCKSVVAVDVSETMLREVRETCEARKVQNVTLVKSDDRLSGVKGQFDFINSSIVFQHIPCDRGIQLFQRLVELLRDDGFGALQFTYAKGGGEIEQPNLRSSVNWPGEDGFWHHLSGLKRALGRRLVRLGARLKSNQSRPANSSGSSAETVHATVEPTRMQMNAYALNPIFACLQNAGVRQLHVAFTDHGGTFGTTIFFQRCRRPSYLLPALFEEAV